MNKLWSAIILTFYAISLSAVPYNADIHRLTDSELPGIKENRWEIFSENSLWGYINGGADIYLEYGFQEMSVQDIVWQNERFKIDAYVMNSPEAAYGIFSVSRFNCQSSNTNLSPWQCIGKNQIQAVKGQLYLSVIAYSGKDIATDLASQIAKKVLQKVDFQNFELPTLLLNSKFALDKSSVKLITGQLAIQNSFSAMEKAFVSIPNYKLWVSTIQINSSEATLLYVTFKNESDCIKVANKIAEIDRQYALEIKGNSVLAVKPKNQGDANIFNNLIKQLP
jgi:hypothetical protein